jgi:uncharacterized C2H2 Zn-finger protein
MSGVSDALQCPYCDYKFTRKSTLNRHVDLKLCRLLNDKSKVTLDELSNEVKEMKNMIQNLTLNKIIHNNNNKTTNNLKVFLIGNGNNFLQMLTEQFGALESALKFIENCALSDYYGDCQFLRKLYFEGQTDTSDPNIYYPTKSQTHVVYRNDQQEKVTESRDSFIAKMAKHLQQGYLEGNRYFNANRDFNQSNSLLDFGDIETWNNHIYKLNDTKYQKKILTHLCIPIHKELRQ